MKRLSHYERALALARATRDRHMQGNLLGNLGKLHMEVGRTDEAHVRCEQALAIARDTGDRRLEGNMLCNLGMLYIVLERHAESEAASQAALVVARELGNVRIEAIVLCNLGIVIERQGRLRRRRRNSKRPCASHARSAIRSPRASSWLPRAAARPPGPA